MPLPFRHRDLAVTSKVFGFILHKLDLDKPDRHSAEIAAVNLLADSSRVTLVSHDKMMEVKRRYCLSSEMLAEIGLKAIQDHLIFSMTGDELSASARDELKHIAHIFEIPAQRAIAGFKRTALEIFSFRLRQAQEDGEMTPEKRAQLDRVRKTLGLQIEVPPVGTDWESKATYAISKHMTALREFVQVLSEAVLSMRQLLDVRPDIMNHTEIILDIDSVSVNCDEAKHWLEVLAQHKASIASKKMDGQTAFAKIHEMEVVIEHDFQPLIDKLPARLTIINLASTRPPNGQDDLESLRTKVNTRVSSREVIRKHGFEPVGSPKQMAWANDIIMGSVITDPLYLMITAAAKKTAPTPQDEEHIRFLIWLQHRLASWWINTGQNHDLQGHFDAWIMKEEKPKRSRKKKVAEFQ